jgi:phosphoglycerol transferase MdoB-like AlkP superfamily enzyme
MEGTQVDRATHAGRAHRDASELALLSLGLAMLLVAVKVLLLPFPVQTVGQLSRYLLRLALVASNDLCFVAALAAGSALISWLLRRWPRIYRGWRLSLFAIFYCCGLYGVLSLSMYQITLVPFTIRLLSFAGGPVMMASSIEKYVTWPVVLALVFVPMGLVAIPKIVPAWLQWRPFSPRLRCLLAGTAASMVVFYGMASHAYMATHWTEPNKWERRISQNPHAVLLASCVEELLKEQPLTTSLYFEQVDDSDFRLPPVPAEETILPPSARQRRPKNVVVFFLESSGAEYLSLHGSRHDTTPHLARLAAEKGVMFEDLYVHVPNSCKSLVSLTASVYPLPDWKLICQDSPDFRVPTIAGVLSQQGYRTCFLHAGYWSWRNRDEFLRKRGVQTLIGAENIPGRRINTWGVSDQAMFEQALHWIDAKPADPFFLLAYTIETHHPYAVPKHPLRFDVKDAELNSYLNALRATDERIAWFIDELARRGLEEETLIVVTTDHGESFGQHNQREHMFGVYQPNVHIPLVLLHPSLAGLPKRIAGVREQIDLAPTILDLLGYEAPPQWQGRNLFRRSQGRPAYFMCVGNSVVLGLRDENLKYHYYVDSGSEELFDLSTDPGEQHNLASQDPARCAEYRQRVGGLVQYQRRYLAQHGVR